MQKMTLTSKQALKQIAKRVSVPTQKQTENAKPIFSLQFGSFILQIKKE